jgi:hypothetical protein
MRRDGDLVVAEFEDNVYVALIFETFLVSDDIRMLETLMDFDFSDQLL